MRILLVEDEKRMAQALCEILRLEKYDVDHYDNGTDGLAAIESNIYDIVILDVTKFCTYEEFEKGVATLKDFCLLRAQSVKGQLGGTIGTTSATQKNETLIDASHINTSDMGSMGGGKGGFGGNMQRPQSSSDSSTNSEASAEKPSSESDTAESNNSNSRPQMPGDFGGMSPEFSGGESRDKQNIQMQRPDGNFLDRGQSQTQKQNMISASSLATIIASILILGFGIVFALKYKRRR